MAELLQVRRLSRSFGSVRAVEKLSFGFDAGRIWGFIGPNGAGKTTTMRILATLDLPDLGNAFVDGVSILDQPREVRRRIGFMSDHFTPYGNLTVLEYLDFFARAAGLRGKRRLDAVRSVAGFCQLQEFRDRPTTGLSKGMGQRLHLAKTLLHDPRLLILDEPASGLDPRARIEFRELIRELAANGKGVLISSHILAELSETCHGVVVIEKGKKVVDGPIDEVARALGEHRRLRVDVLGSTEAAAKFFAVQPHAHNVVELDGGVSLDWSGDAEALAAMLTLAVQTGLRLVEYCTTDADLEEIFMRTTKGRLG